ncbi:PhzF family phenazine biosynthesis protein, partial [Staphylococcus succinus]
MQVTAKGSKVDCVSRSFAPKLNVKEDPVCGSGHCHIIPYWSDKLKKDNIVAYQASSRDGIIYDTYKNEKLLLYG